MSMATAISAVLGQPGARTPVPAAAPASNASVAARSVAVEAKTDPATKPGPGLTAQSVQEINAVMSAYAISVRFRIDPDVPEPIIQVVDQDSGKLIRQIPSEEAVQMAKALDNLKGLLFAQVA